MSTSLMDNWCLSPRLQPMSIVIIDQLIMVYLVTPIMNTFNAFNKPFFSRLLFIVRHRIHFFILHSPPFYIFEIFIIINILFGHSIYIIRLLSCVNKPFNSIPAHTMWCPMDSFHSKSSTLLLLLYGRVG